MKCNSTYIGFEPDYYLVKFNLLCMSNVSAINVAITTYENIIIITDMLAVILIDITLNSTTVYCELAKYDILL